MWKFVKNVIKRLFGKKKKSIRFTHNGRTVHAVAIGKDVTMKISQEQGKEYMTSDELDEILEELARRLK